MKIRTITIGTRLDKPQEIIPYITKVKQAKSFFEEKGYEVQTIRISINQQQDELKIKELINICKTENLSYLSIGQIDPFSPIADKIPEVLSQSEILNCSINLLFGKDHLEFTAKLIVEISHLNPYINFQFAGSANIPPNTPFFPAGYHEDTRPSFSIGTQAVQEAIDATYNCESLDDAKIKLLNIYNEVFIKIEKIALQLEKQIGIEYAGIDTSTASLGEESTAYIIENISKVPFGKEGTKEGCQTVTSVLKLITVKKAGYCGLMLPLLEDSGLGKRNNEGLFTIDDLLDYSSVCGTGLDTVPIAGNVTISQVSKILQKVVSLSQKLNKPLSARLFPVPGKVAGEMTEFDSPYLFNTKVMRIE